MQKIKKYKGYLILFAIIIVSLISIIIQNIDKKSNLKINGTEINKMDDKIAVYISGAVKNPGLYYIEDGSRISNLLDICGGITEEADINKLNLAKKVVDSDKITVPVKQKEGAVDIAEEINEESGDKININTASKEELKTLSGIGDSTANKIIEHRKTQKFVRIEDIMDVPGIGESKFNSIKDNICVD